MSVMTFNAQDNVPPEGMSPEEFDSLQEHMAIIHDTALHFVEQYFARLSSIRYRKVSDDGDEATGYDLIITDDKVCLLCVKSTEGNFDNPIHISYNELLQMRESDNYDLYRVYEIIEMTAQLRIAHNVQSFAEDVLTVLEQLPDGVKPDSISVLSEVLNFGESVLLEIPEDDE